ncbi:IS3 family transposase [Acinetobacter haemolyticus]|uniref:IS3 family transposase n=1 Tax=Acinetobacter haemolyticus TaxID=29430 RepID=A0AAJ3D926_ACIHA|nr:IS3 family transposase [Acinetobacter haemolyticus]NAR31184.1 IS3 family transposase [Acinetobacter haemolyticus]NAR37286.1 IS3 family transposase [Acinetobacter haemolyticus]NAR48928.1 IS3 family transposase [Acinetobacter haemolyticus]NAR65285.1 IS3 family transposase [Acinetobacter haemolyticus]NAR74382.1 IS3 family transposase [Acinetobacter haemolyticus]
MTKPNYTPEIRERAVRLLLESEKDYPSTWAAITAIAPKIGCTPETLRSWLKKHHDQENPVKAEQLSDQQRIKQLERENKELQRANEILRKAAAFFGPSGTRPPTQIMVNFIHAHKAQYGVDAICKVLPIAASTYYRQLDLSEHPEKRSKRDLQDQHDAKQIKQIWQESSGRYGVRKVWKQLKQDGYSIARCTVTRLMQQLEIQGVWRGKNKCTTRSRDDQKRATDLVKRDFSAKQPNHLWVADFTYIQTNTGWVYTAFIIDVFSRAIVGWKVSKRMNTDMVLDALEQALHDRGMPENVIHHSDRGVQYLSIRYTSRLEAANLKASVGTTGDSYDNALAETVNGLYKMEVIDYLKSDWTGLADVELATLDWVDWFNKKRLHSAIGYVSPFQFEAMYYARADVLDLAA